MNDANSTFNGTGRIQELSPPVLDIQLMTEFPLVIAGRHMEDPFSDRVRPMLRLTFSGSNTSIAENKIDRVGTCQQTAKYKFGFSFLLLFVVLVLFIIWLLGTYLMFVDAFVHTKLDLAKRDMGIYRAVLDISSVLNTDTHNDILGSLTPNRMLKKTLHPKGKPKAAIGLQALSESLPPDTRKAMILNWSRAGGHSRWIPRIIICSLLITLCVSPLLWGSFSTRTRIFAVLFMLLFLAIISVLVLRKGRKRNPMRTTSNDHVVRGQPTSAD